MVWYQTSHCYVIMALRLVTAICLIVKYVGESLLKTIDRLTADVTAWQSKSPVQKIAQQYACAPAGYVV